MRAVGLVGLTLVLAITLAGLSVFVERAGPELAAYGNLCGPNGNSDCMEPVLKGGFPFAYLFDAPGVSVEHQLSFGEDDFSPGAFTLDVLAYLVIVGLGLRSVHLRIRRARRPRAQ